MKFLKPGFVQIFFGGGGGGGGGGGSDGGGFLSNIFSSPSPSRATRPEPRPSVLTRGDQMVATRDMPRFGISTGDTASTPSYSPFSVRGLTSTDTGNVMRNIQGAERNIRAEQARTAGSNGDDDSSSTAEYTDRTPSPTRSTAAAPAATTPTPPEPPTEGAAVDLAEETAKRGRASTIATSPSGILGEANTRQRRSLVGGGLIR